MIRQQQYAIVPNIRTSLPGPNATQLIHSDEQYLSPSYTRVYPLVVKRGKGAAIEDVDGNIFLDFTAGIAVCSTGHCHPCVVSAIQRQAADLIHMSGTDFYYAPQRDLAIKLAHVAPGKSPKKVFFSNSGAEAVEAAFKLARYHTKRSHMISFFGGFHGRTMGALSLTGSKVIQRRGFAPLVPNVIHLPYGHRDGVSIGTHLDHLFRRTVSPDEVAGIIVEPIQGEGGYIVPPAEFLFQIKEACEKHGILFIADEVQSGMGRTGKMFAIEHWGIEPDIICLAKGVASGMPLGAIVARADVMDWPRGAHASTFGGNPIACAAALETIRLLEEELMVNAADVGTYLIDELFKLKSRHPMISDVRGIGLMVGMELRDPRTGAPATAEKEELIQRCFNHGLLLLGCGESTIRFCPPLVITREDVKTALNIVSSMLAEMEAESAETFDPGNVR